MLKDFLHIHVSQARLRIPGARMVEVFRLLGAQRGGRGKVADIDGTLDVVLEARAG